MSRSFSIYLLVVGIMFYASRIKAQSNNPAPYCSVTYANLPCNTPGPSNSPGNTTNDFINDFITCGGNNDIVNTNSGCNGLPNNYIYYGNTYTLIVAPNQSINCKLRSGITFAQGFAIFIDWNQNNVFDLPGERVAVTASVPGANTWTNLNFIVPASQPVGNYRMRVRCAYFNATPAPCGSMSYGETEDYDVVVQSTNYSTVQSGTITSNSPVCGGETLNLSIASNPPVSAVQWAGPNAFSSSQPTLNFANASSNLSGIYTVTLGTGGCPFITTVAVSVAPNAGFVLTPSNNVICQGNHFTAAVTFTNPVSINSFSYSWTSNAPSGAFQTPSPGTGIYTPGSYNTVIGPGLINGSQLVLQYTVVVTPTLMSCPVTNVLTLTINNPITPTLTLPANLCNTFTPVLLSATPGGGTWSASPAVSPSGLFTPGLAAIGTNTLSYSVSAGTCNVSNTGTLTVSQYNTPALTSSISTLCIADSPFDLISIVQSSINGTWSGTQVNANYFNPANLPSGNYALTYSTTSSPVASVCPASTILLVPVFHPPAPLITNIPELCNNTGTFQLSASPTVGLLWTGNTGVSSTGILSPSACAIGLNNITCTGGLGTCVASSNTTFTISEYRTAAFSGTVPNLCVSSNAFNLMTIVQNTNGAWSGISPNTSSTAFSPFAPPLFTGVYTLTYTNHSWPNAGLCPETRTMAVSVLNPTQPNILQVGPYCNLHAPVQLSVTPHTGTWTASSYLTTSGLFTPSLSPVGNNIVQYVIGTSTCNVQQTAVISVEGFVPATISSTIADQCVTSSPVNLLPFTLNTLGSWSGPGIIGASFNPAISGIGHVVISYSTSSSPSGLCPDQATVAVNVFSLSTPVFSSQGPFCNSSPPFKLNVSPVGGIFGGANTGAIDAGGLFIPASALIGNNIINYSITLGPCVAYAQATVAVERFVPAGFIATAGPFCRNDARLLRNLEEIAESPGGLWSGPGVSGSIFTFKNANTGNNVVNHLTHSLPTATLCPDTKTIQIQVYDVPEPQLMSSSYQACAPTTISLNTPNMNSGIGLWDFGDGSEPQEGLSVTHPYSTPGSYTVALSYSVTVATDLSCVAHNSLLKPIRIYASPSPDFMYSPVELSIADPSVHFTNTSLNVDQNRYLWTFEGNNSQITNQDLDADFVFPLAGNYKVTLSATNLNGCKTDLTKLITVTNTLEVFIPSTFTPNGDNINEEFFPVFSEYGLDEKSYELQIFDRWGSLLFEGKNKDQHWDGKKAGHPLKEDVYIYKLKFGDANGNVYNKTGYVSIIR